MAQFGTILKHSRTDIQLTGTQQGIGPKPANVLFIYNGEVVCEFGSQSFDGPEPPTTVQDQLIIVLPDADLGLGQIPHLPVPIIFPTHWISLGGLTGHVAVNNPTLSTQGARGLILTADISVQAAILRNVQYQVSVLAVN
jgi:hypothetical protein